ncbi:YeeE/YedE family protein [Brucella pituitosa]|uniref:YeeE/YedE family protein n=1 Tax=Brucella intermedia GD04153 TaxID=2975438 RepID=A0AA42H314_9HYPH|nr:YeeE/YedE family protein [Brucella intermedia]MDH0127094.1 YeeE/YedE family protein [Brucella intermedia GD04153]RRD21526.1 YeeE/YedE family protein [Brucellaceae bacterium VT-16-1752]
MDAYLAPIAGGLLIGLSASLLMFLNGRIAGISGIVGGLLGRRGERFGHDIAFVAGLVLGPLAYLAIFGALPQVQIAASTPLLIVAGLLVGLGTRMGSGCTSGHGISGLARLSPRSFVAVLTFLATGILTVLIMRTGGWL